MNKENIKILTFFLILIFFFIGFYVGRKTIKKETTNVDIIYIKGDTITDSISYPLPYEVIKPIDTLDIIKKCINDGIYSDLFPEKIIKEYVTFTSDDTLAIINDWATRRNYSEVLFDVDTIGKCNIDISLQYNRIANLKYEYIPIQKIIKEKENKIKHFSPFIGIGTKYYNNRNLDIIELNPSLTFGFYINERYGINFSYDRMLNEKNNLYGISFLFKF